MKHLPWPILFAGPPIILVGCSNASDIAPLDVVVRGPASSCKIEIEGRKVTEDELLTIGTLEAKSGRRVHIVSDMQETPYRCIGGVIFTLQKAGVKDVEFGANPAPK